MQIAPFETEHFFARYEFNTPWQLCNSDCESLPIAELLAMAGRSMDDFGSERLVYTDSRGSPELRQSIAGLYENVDPGSVVLLGTPVEGIYLAARALLEPGDEVIVLSPAYDALINLFEHVVGPGCVKKWQFRAGSDGWELDLGDLRDLKSDRTRLLVVNFPHNPTGFVPSPAMQNELMREADESGFLIFCDEMYYGLRNQGTPWIPSAADLSTRSIVLSGLSKTYGLPGLRCGWLVVHDTDLRESIVNWKFYTSICPPVPTEFLANAALQVAEELRSRNQARIARNLLIAEDFFSRWPQLFRWRRPLGGSTALVGFDVPSVGELSARLAEQQGILIQSARMLGGDDQHMRLGLGREDFPLALERFEDWLRKSDLDEG